MLYRLSRQASKERRVGTMPHSTGGQLDQIPATGSAALIHRHRRRSPVNSSMRATSNTLVSQPLVRQPFAHMIDLPSLEWSLALWAGARILLHKATALSSALTQVRSLRAARGTDQSVCGSIASRTAILPALHSRMRRVQSFLK
jgi:hypothetical protein